VTTTLQPVVFRKHAAEFEKVLGDAPRLSVVAEVDAHEGPVYFADENALYFTTWAKPGVGEAPSVQIKRLALDEGERGATSVNVGEANAANGMAPLERDGEAADDGPVADRPDHDPASPKFPVITGR
jgi:hypothetical protein